MKKGGKKGRKAMLAAARVDPSITTIPNRIVDMATLVDQIKRFLNDLGGRQTMALPPMEKEDRKMVHELAAAFNLKSQSKGKGQGRYTTLSKTTRSGVGVNVKKVDKIVRNGRGDWSGKDKGKTRFLTPKNKEGDEVGKVRLFHSVFYRTKKLTCNEGGAENRRKQYWFQDAGFDGLAGRRSNWGDGWVGRASHGCDQEYEVGLGCIPVIWLSVEGSFSRYRVGLNASTPWSCGLPLLKYCPQIRIPGMASGYG